jgi:hypothetical protein
MAVVGATVAWALLSLRADINGGGNFAAPADLQITAASIVNETDVDCQTAVSGGDMSLQMVDGVQGGRCEIDVTLQRTGATSPAAQISDVQFAGPVLEQFVPGAGGCGTAIPATGTVSVRVRFTLDGTPGTFTAQPDAGIYASDTPNPGCPSV